MGTQHTRKTFDGQDFWLGMDVHQRNWKVTIRTVGIELKTMVMPPEPKCLQAYMLRHYPGGRYHCVYEAGFSGFWAHRQLQDLGFDSRVAHAADVPTSDKERQQKDDVRDARKLAKELEKGGLHGIHVPSPELEKLRSLCRLRERCTSHMTRLKNRIKGFLKYYGIRMEEDSAYRHWSGAFLDRLAVLAGRGDPAADCLGFTLEALRQEGKRLADIMRGLRRHCRDGEAGQVIALLRSVPGIGPKAAFTLYTELQDITRFRNLDKLYCYIGLVPSTDTSGDNPRTTGLTNRQHRLLRMVLVESAWTAIKHDPVLFSDFAQLARRMKKQAAIIRIARKVVARVSHVWRTRTPYQTLEPTRQAA